MTDNQFIAFMELLMCSDPWPLHWGHGLLNDLADEQARARGFSDWIAAYHEFDRLTPVEKTRIDQEARP